MQKSLSWVFVMSVIFTMTGCASQSNSIVDNPPGIFTGIFHGATLLPSFIASILTDIRIYAFPNSGVMYDFGYLMGVYLGWNFFGQSKKKIQNKTPSSSSLKISKNKQ